MTPELLKEKLVSLSDCAAVICADKEQKSVVEALAEAISISMTLSFMLLQTSRSPFTRRKDTWSSADALSR